MRFDARATDDFGLRSLALRYTKVTGSGENFEFQEGEIPLTLKPASAARLERQRVALARRTGPEGRRHARLPRRGRRCAPR